MAAIMIESRAMVTGIAELSKRRFGQDAEASKILLSQTLMQISEKQRHISILVNRIPRQGPSAGHLTPFVPPGTVMGFQV